MDIKKAAKSMRKIIYENPIGYNHIDGTEREHLLFMCNQIMKGNISGEQAHRWLGWIQGCLTCTGIVTLERCKRINHKA